MDITKELSAKGFDPSTYGRLDIPANANKFVYFVIDYAQNARTHCQGGNCKATSQQIKMARAFAKMVNDDSVWQLAQQYMPELRIEHYRNKPIAKCRIVTHIWKGIEDRGAKHETVHSTELQKWEYEHYWKRLRTRISLVANAVESTVKSEDLERVMADMAKVVHLASLPELQGTDNDERNEDAEDA